MFPSYLQLVQCYSPQATIYFSKVSGLFRMLQDGRAERQGLEIIILCQLKALKGEVDGGEAVEGRTLL